MKQLEDIINEEILVFLLQTKVSDIDEKKENEYN